MAVSLKKKPIDFSQKVCNKNRVLNTLRFMKKYLSVRNNFQLILNKYIEEACVNISD